MEYVPSSGILRADMLVTKNKVSNVSHFDRISLNGLKSGMENAESMVCNVQVRNLCICEESFRDSPLTK